MGADTVEVVVPREGVNDDVAHVVRWLVPDGGAVVAEQVIVIVETTKAAFDLTAPKAGWIFHLAPAGAEVVIGSAVALVSSSPQRPNREHPVVAAEASGQAISRRARELIAQHGIPVSHFAGLSAVREADVLAVLAQRASAASVPAERRFAGESLDLSADWDAVLQSGDYKRLEELFRALRRRLRARFNRHVPTGTLLYDRWQLARDNGYGEGTSIYDECLILGDVTVGKHCWVGPFTILDGSKGKLTIGDYVDVGSGTHIYTHNTIERALTGHKAPIFGNATTIGNCCFLAPHVVVGAGTVLGDHCFVATGSYLEGKYAPYSYIAGNPGRVVGVVEIHGDRARVRAFAAESTREESR